MTASVHRFKVMFDWSVCGSEVGRSVFDGVGSSACQDATIKK